VNLPMAQEALRARASRTTHPKSLHLLSLLAGAVIEREFVIDNPFLFKTKADVVNVLKTHETTDLIPFTCSCSHLIFQASNRRHCGKCSQCIDRRFAVTDAGLLDKDPESDYVSDVFTGPRPKDLDRSIAVDYARHGVELASKSVIEMGKSFNAEIGRAVFYEKDRRHAGQVLLSMYQRHGQTVLKVLTEQVEQNAGKLVAKTIEKTSLLALTVGQNYLAGGELLEGYPPLGDHETSQYTPGERALMTKFDQFLEVFRGNRSGLLANKKQVKQNVPTKRETVLFAAIVSDLKGRKYCDYLDQHKLVPKWADEGPASYRLSYTASEVYKKKVQDEKTRAKKRMNKYPVSVLQNAFIKYLDTEFDTLSPLLNSLNSLHASKKVVQQPTA
jgi:hypothetical protein